MNSEFGGVNTPTLLSPRTSAVPAGARASAVKTCSDHNVYNMWTFSDYDCFLVFQSKAAGSALAL